MQSQIVQTNPEE